MIRKVKRKSLGIKYSGRSSDFITPSFGHGCLFKCGYCYMRRHKPNGLDMANNFEEIIDNVISHHSKLIPKVANQTHKSKWTYDIGCNEDVALHWKHGEFKYAIEAMIKEDIFPTFATKYVNEDLLNIDFKHQARIRFSLMPQEYAGILEPNTSSILDRIKAISKFRNSGWDVHINFSPVIFNPGAKQLYEELFTLVNEYVEIEDKYFVEAEVIMLTHNIKLHEFNISSGDIPTEKLLWYPDRQENKISTYKGENLRYKKDLKRGYVESFKHLHNQIIPWNTIRYIF